MRTRSMSQTSILRHKNILEHRLTSKRGRKSVGNTVFPSHTAPDDKDDEGAGGGGGVIIPGDVDLSLVMCGTSSSHDRTTRRRMQRSCWST